MGLLTGRVLRGGSWNNNANNCRVANRNNNPDNRNNNNGFRIVLHFQLTLTIKPGIARFTDYASVVLKALVPFLSDWFIKLMTEFTLYGRVGLVGLTPNVPSG